MALPKCLLYNVRALTANNAVKKNSVSTLLRKYHIECTFLTETWLRASHNNALCDIQGYLVYRQDRKVVNGRGKSHGGGVCIYIRNGFTLSCHRWWPTASNNIRVGTPSTVEVIWLSLVLIHGQQLIIASIYVPPKLNKTNKSRVLNYLKKCVEMARINYPQASVVIAGDFDDLKREKILSYIRVTAYRTGSTTAAGNLRGEALDRFCMFVCLVALRPINTYRSLGPTLGVDAF
jgi:hypothetical protein